MRKDSICLCIQKHLEPFCFEPLNILVIIKSTQNWLILLSAILFYYKYNYENKNKLFASLFWWEFHFVGYVLSSLWTMTANYCRNLVSETFVGLCVLCLLYEDPCIIHTSQDSLVRLQCQLVTLDAFITRSQVNWRALIWRELVCSWVICGVSL